MPNTDIEELYMESLNFLINALENGEIETGLAKNSQGKGGYSISNETTIRLSELIQQKVIEAQENMLNALIKSDAFYERFELKELIKIIRSQPSHDKKGDDE